MEENTVEINMKLNGTQFTHFIDSRETLLDILRDRAGLTGAKKGCDEAACGACTVLMDGRAVCSCTVLGLEAEGREIITVEGLPDLNLLHPIQDDFIENDSYQCGFCTSGQELSAVSIKEHLSEESSLSEIRESMSGNVCRCGAYVKITQAVEQYLKREDEH